MKSSKGKISVVTALALIVIAIALTISITMGLALKFFNKNISNVTQKRVLLEYISKADEYVEANYYGNINEKDLSNSLIKGYLNGINDGKSMFLSGEEYLKIKGVLSGQWLDFGLELAQMFNGPTVVVYVHENSPAGKAGINVGDVVLSLDGEDVSEKTTDYIVNKLKTVDKANFVVSHGMENEEKTIEISKSNFTYQSVRYQIIDQLSQSSSGSYKLGYIRITDFHLNTDDQFEAAFKSLLAENVTGFIFDVRFNNGGNIDTVNNILKMLLPKTEYATLSKKGEVLKHVGESTMPLELPSVVIVDGHTVCEAELFSAALKQSGKAKIVGQSTKGDTSIASYFEVGTDHSAIKITVGELSLSGGASWKETGVEPDREALVEIGTFIGIVPLTFDEDIPLLAAAEELTGIEIINKSTGDTRN